MSLQIGGPGVAKTSVAIISMLKTALDNNWCVHICTSTCTARNEVVGAIARAAADVPLLLEHTRVLGIRNLDSLGRSRTMDALVGKELAPNALLMLDVNNAFAAMATSPTQGQQFLMALRTMHFISAHMRENLETSSMTARNAVAKATTITVGTIGCFMRKDACRYHSLVVDGRPKLHTLIVDESSSAEMGCAVNLEVAMKDAVSPATNLVMVGDPGQLAGGHSRMVQRFQDRYREYG